MWGQSLPAIVAALKGMGGGYFVMRDEDGAEFVVTTKKEFDRLSEAEPDGVQLPLTSAPQNPAEGGIAGQAPEADEILERINKELAEYQAGQEIETEIEEDFESEAEEPVNKVKFEPLKGDLPPELQE